METLVRDLVASGRVVDIALAVLAVEVALIVVYRRRFGRADAVGPALWNLGAGGGLLLALRAALTGAGPLLVLAPLAGALACHLADSWQRLAPRPGTAPAPEPPPHGR